jgi:hypothetical protein
MPKIKVTASPHTAPLAAGFAERPDMEEDDDITNRRTVALYFGFYGDDNVKAVQFPANVSMNCTISSSGRSDISINAQPITRNLGDPSTGYWQYPDMLIEPITVTRFVFSQPDLPAPTLDPSTLSVNYP